MPPKSKRRKMLEEKLRKAREAKKKKLDRSVHSSASIGTEPSANSPCDSDSDDESYNPENEFVSDSNLQLETFAEDWVVSLDRENMISLALFLTFHFEHLLKLSQTDSAEYVSIMLGKSDRTIRQWISEFLEAGGEIPANKQGRYQRTGLLWSLEDLNEQASKYILEHANDQGEVNLTSTSFRHWVNHELLPNSTLEPCFPQHISLETARQWMHKLGFRVLLSSKGRCSDEHGRKDGRRKLWHVPDQAEACTLEETT